MSTDLITFGEPTHLHQLFTKPPQSIPHSILINGLSPTRAASRDIPALRDMAVSHNPHDEAAEAERPASPAASDTDMALCLSCETGYSNEDLLELPCHDRYCKDCLTTLFEAAIKDEELFPPRCCGLRISFKLARTQLPKDLAKRFKMIRLELSTKQRTYCCVPACSTFIAPHSIHNGQAICQSCRTVTCSKCRNKWHFGPCTEGDESAFFDLARAEKWKKCPTCLRFVEKTHGCNLVM